MRVTHIFHDGFAVETEAHSLIFDWYEGELPPLPKDKPLYVFVTHGHGDHYGSCIWELRTRFGKVIYILDETASPVPEGIRIYKVKENASYEIEDVKLQTFHSTDQGCAFYVEIDGKRLFHAGDLNIWYWFDEPASSNRASEEACMKEFGKLGKQLKGEKLDAAFLALDPRLKEEAPRGIEGFLKCADAKAIFPMHYGTEQTAAKEYLADRRLLDAADKLHFSKVTILE